MAEGTGGGEDGFQRLQRRLLQPPRLTATADLPLRADKVESDNFDLGYRLGPIYDILRHPRTETPLAIAIYGDWGSGKTSAMKWLEARLKDWNEHVAGDKADGAHPVRLIPVWFYPWKYQEREDVWRGLVAEVILATIRRNQAVEKAREQAKGLEFLGRGLMRLVSGVKLQLGAGNNKVTLDLKDVFKDDATETRPEADYLNEFESAFEGWLTANLGDKERMVVFIDDLDRCLPQVALQVLEALKLYLNLPRLVFVAGVDRTVINQLVQRHYHALGLDEEKSGDYLGKMFQVEVTVAPSDSEAGKYLDGVLAGNETWEELEEWQRDIFRGVICNLVRRSPREIKRVVNSALIAGEGIEMSSRNWADGGVPPTLAHGIQNELIRRILRDRYQRETLLGSEIGNAFFGQWSNIVCTNPDFERVCRISRADLARLSGDDRDPATVARLGENISDERQESEILDSIPQRWHRLVKQSRYRPFMELLADIDLANLMRVPFSAEAAEAQREDIPVDAQRIVDEAVARKFEKFVDDLTNEDRENVTDLKIDASDFEDTRPLAALTKLAYLDLDGTQVTDLAPLASLPGLQTLFLNHTPVSNLDSLAGLTGLQMLSLTGTLVRNLGPLDTLKKLEGLNLRATELPDLSPLAALENLKVLWLEGATVNDDQVRALKAALPNLEVHR